MHEKNGTHVFRNLSIEFKDPRKWNEMIFDFIFIFFGWHLKNKRVHSLTHSDMHGHTHTSLNKNIVGCLSRHNFSIALKCLCWYLKHSLNMYSTCQTKSDILYMYSVSVNFVEDDWNRYYFFFFSKKFEYSSERNREIPIKTIGIFFWK